MLKEKLQFMLSAVIYGTIGTFLRFTALPSEIVALGRGVFGSLFLLAFIFAKKEKIDRAAIRANRFWLVLSGFSLGMNWILLFEAYRLTTVAIASLCDYMAPLIVIVIAPFILKERLDMRKIPCVVAAFVGIILVSGITGSGSANASGVAFGLGAAVFFVTLIICNRKITDIDGLTRTLVQIAVSAVTVLPYALFHTRFSELQFDVRSVVVVIILGVVHTGMAYCLYFAGLGSLPVQTVTILGYVEPVVSVTCSAVFLREPMSAVGWVGAAMILTAAAVSELMPEPESKKIAQNNVC